MKKEVEKILMHFGFNLPVVEDSDFYVEMDAFGFPSVMSIPDKNYKMTKQQWEIEQATRKYVAGWNLGVSYELIAILHEIGHIVEGFTEDEFDTYYEDTDILAALYNNGTLTSEQYVDIYNALPVEANANSWAANWIRNNKDLAKYWDICLKV